MRNEDKRVGKNPAGYLVASIRADYQAPGDFPTPEAERQGAEAVEAGRAADEAKRQEQHRVRAEAEHTQAREAELRAAWERLPEAERDEILAAVKAENPGLSRWKTDARTPLPRGPGSPPQRRAEGVATNPLRRAGRNS